MRSGRVRFFNGVREVAACHVQLTETVLERTRGLLGRPKPGSDEALLITPCNAVHTFGMRYALDLVYIARNGAVRKIVHALPPRRLSGCLRAHAVLELVAGTVAHWNLDRGMKMEWCNDD